MREIKLWNVEGNLDGFVKRVKDNKKRAFIQEYIEYIEGFNEEYYFDNIEGYVHEDYDDVF
ncbi:TPA: hypothetical protein ACF2DD_002044 [Clostridium perfringens]|uniref:hypothetical protein n=1 Tax=Clostridium perfringens TaxID=1502 RepID=UPI00338DF9F4|nr:hypothetical protein [Clostridium perfringens]